MADILEFQPIARPIRREGTGEARILLFTGAWRERYDEAPDFSRPARRPRAAKPAKPPARRA